jgi:intein/homing endonuclease
MEHGGKRAIAICHRRWGKDEIALHWAAVAMHRRPADYWHCLPHYSQARKAIWTAVNPHSGKRRIDEAFPHALREQTWEHEMAIRFKNGAMWRVVGSDNPDSLVGTAPAGLVMSEYAMSNPSSWGYLAPILAENDGWAMFITTPRGRNHAYQTYQLARETPGWLAERCDVHRSGFPLHRVEEQRREYYKIFGKDAGDALIEQEYFCFPPGTPIWTDRGQRAIEDIGLGDVVLTHAGRWRKVTKLYQHGHQGEMVEIHSAGSPVPLVCTPNHPVRVCDPATQEYRWVQAGQVAAGQYVVLPRIKLPPNPLLDADLAALIGWFIAEGSVMKNAVQFALGDEPHVAEKLRLAGERFGKVSVSPLLGQKGLAVQINSAWLADFLTMHCGSGASAKRIPWSLIAGHERTVYEALIEGDGCRGDYGGARDVFTTISHSLALDVQMLAHMLGMRAGVHLRPKEKAAQHFQGRPITVRDAYSVRVSVIRKNGKYYGSHTRPQILPQKHGVAALVKKVERKPYAGTVHNFAVQHDESYVAAGRVVHNCSFEAAILGAFWGRVLADAEAEGRLHATIRPHPQLPIHRAWDLGKGAHMAIWFFQVVGSQIWVLDYVSGHAIGIPGFAKIIREEKNLRGGIDFVPHDAAVVELGTEKSRLETMKLCGLNPRLIARHLVADRINAGHRVIPRCHFDSTACAEGLNGLRNYRAEWDQETLRFGNSPVADWSTHPSDAFGYLCYSIEEVTGTRPQSPGKVVKITMPGEKSPANQVTLADLLTLSEPTTNPMGYQ